MADPSSFQLGDTGADENLHRSDPKGEVSVMKIRRQKNSILRALSFL